MRHTTPFLLISALTAGLLALPVSAGEALNAAQLKEMFNNKTITAQNPAAGNKTQLTYFAADGKIVQKTPTGEKKEGTWRLTDNGQQCITWAGQGEVCSTVVSRGDGTYQRMVGEKATVLIQKSRAGNLLDE